jgi:hypothetical protein
MHVGKAIEVPVPPSAFLFPPVSLHFYAFLLIPLISSYFLLTVEYPYLYEPRSAIYSVTCFQGIFGCARRCSEAPLLDPRC